jgi:septal ring factor EnvC (AmiA/AmiB activator)
MDVEKLSVAAKRSYDRLCEANQKIEDYEVLIKQIEADVAKEVDTATHNLTKEIKRHEKKIAQLQHELTKDEDDKLALRIRSKMMAQYGIEHRDALEAFFVWLDAQGKVPSLGRYSDKGLMEESEVCEILDDYLRYQEDYIGTGDGNE